MLKALINLAWKAKGVKSLLPFIFVDCRLGITTVFAFEV